ncbi:MAG: ABC transporter permease, partial [Rhizobiaceae bacterium]|nr:ABC transporter permease [Rhizobiaceae bacterium]
MTELNQIIEAPARQRQEKLLSVINKSEGWFGALGLAWLPPLLKIAIGYNVKTQLSELRHTLVIPLVGILIFLAAWAILAPKVQTSLGTIPGPAQVLEQAGYLWDDHLRTREKAVAFYAREDIRNAKLIAEGKEDKVKHRKFTGKTTYIDQIVTSLITVLVGFLFASAIAIPLGIASGLSKSVNGAISPLIQIFKPVSPLAWLPIVTMIVSALYVDTSDWLPKSMVVSAVTVTLCSLWPTLINTTLGVASI